MEPAAADHHQQQQAHHPININNNDQELGGKNTSSSNSNFLCRQSSTRWTPTSEQIRILKELYYNNGVRSPTAEQIQRISAKLRQYGKIEGKNVFYWFQNHKARERQKKRFTADHHLHHHHHQFHHSHVTMHRTSTSSASASACKTNNNNNNNNEDHVMISTRFYNKFSAGSNNINHGPAAGNFASSSNYTPGNLLPVANYGYGSVAMEKSFRECSITPNGGGSMAGQNFAWVGVNNDPSYTFLEKRKYTHQTLEIEDEDQEQDPTAAAASLPEIETLPLFPMHGDDIKNQETSDYFNGWHRRADDSFSAAGGSRASLELTLNSYAARFSATSP